MFPELNNLPPSACIFNCPNFWDSSLPSARSFVFREFQYFRGRELLVNASTTSATENTISLLTHPNGCVSYCSQIVLNYSCLTFDKDKKIVRLIGCYNQKSQGKGIKKLYERLPQTERGKMVLLERRLEADSLNLKQKRLLPSR